MGKGTGACLSSDTPAGKQPAPKTEAAAPAATPAPPKRAPATPEPVKAAAPATAITATAAGKMPTVYIVYYSMYGHIKALVEAAKKGVEGEGTEVKIFQVAETLPTEVLEKMHAPPKADYPVLDAHDLPAADGFIFAFPTRFGRVASQFGAFFDACGQHWQKGALVGKPVTFITSTASQGGGQESTIINALPFVAHQAMIYVPPGFTAGPPMFSLDAARGGSAWGAGTFAGPTGARQPSDDELAVATHTGKYFAGIVKKLAA